jgi:hypothetical protein
MEDPYPLLLFSSVQQGLKQAWIRQIPDLAMMRQTRGPELKQQSEVQEFPQV